MLARELFGAFVPIEEVGWGPAWLQRLRGPAWRLGERAVRARIRLAAFVEEQDEKGSHEESSKQQ